MTCSKCGKPATKRHSPDLDIKGLGACDDCSDDVKIAYLFLRLGNIDIFNDLTKGWFIHR